MMSPRNRRVPYLETSPEMFREWAGDGSSNTGCPSPTGSRTPAILQPKTGSSLPTETQSKRQWGEYSDQEYEEGKACYLRITQGRGWAWEELPTNSQIFWMDEAAYKARVSGNSGEINFDQLQFWKDRRDVPMK